MTYVTWTSRETDLPAVRRSQVHFFPGFGEYLRCHRLVGYQERLSDAADSLARAEMPALRGGYFFYDDAERSTADHDVPANKEERSLWQEADRNWFGELSFEETDKAFDALYGDSLTDVKKCELLSLWLYSFNDTFNGRGKDGRAPTAELLAKQKTVLRLLISMFPDNGLFVCELHREFGEFEECLKVARGLSGQDDFAASVLRQIVAHAEAYDRRVFAISFSRDSLFTMWDEEVHLP